MADSDCVFCSIVAGETEADLVLEDDDLAAALRDPFLATAQRLATAVVEGLGAQGSFVAVNNVVSQSVPHLHLHVVPRTKGDGLRGFFWPRTKYASDDEAREYAGRLAAALART